MQPWHFVAVSDPDVKHAIREAAEREEYRFYHGRAGREWLQALAPLGTDYSKPFLEEAPWLIVVFAERWHLPAPERGRRARADEAGERRLDEVGGPTEPGGAAVDAHEGKGPADRVRHYYVKESVGIAVGFLVAAAHNAGLATLTYTPSRMGFLRTLLGRPENEQPFLVLVVGWPAPGVKVPSITRKNRDEFISWRIDE